MSLKQGKFTKCSLCDEKPATIRCITCSDGNTSNSQKFCYSCEKIQHDNENMRNHKKELIPYSEMCGNSFDSCRENANFRDKIANKTFFESAQTTNERFLIQKKESSLEKFQESIGDYRTSKSSDMKYRIKMQEQENLILFLKNQAENLENKYMENLANMRKELMDSKETISRQKEDFRRENNEKIRNLEEKNILLQRERDLEAGRNRALEDEIEKMRRNREKLEREHEEIIRSLKENFEQKGKNHEMQLENLGAKLEEFKKRSKTEAENEMNALKEEIEEKNQKIKSLEQLVVKEKNEILQKENQLSFLLKAKEEENEKMKRLMDKQKEEISRSDKLAQEIRQEVYILQREFLYTSKKLELCEKENERMKREKEKLERKLDKYEKIIYGPKKEGIRK